MPLRPMVSVLEASIIPQIKNYLQQRVTEEAQKGESDSETSIKMLTDAISLGINEAFKSQAIHSLFTAIVDTNVAAVIPIGETAFSTIIPPATTPSIPNPLL